MGQVYEIADARKKRTNIRLLDGMIAFYQGKACDESWNADMQRGWHYGEVGHELWLGGQAFLEGKSFDFSWPRARQIGWESERDKRTKCVPGHSIPEEACPQPFSWCRAS